MAKTKTKGKQEEKVETQEPKLRSKGGKAPQAPVEPAAEPTPAPEAPKEPETADIVSADNRELEVSVGDKFWKGKTISVPKEQEGDVRRILVEAGFFIK